MTASLKQTEFGGFDPEKEEEAEIEAEYLMRQELFSALRMFVSGYLCNGLKGYDAVAFQLNKRWEPHGRSVTAGPLRASLSPTNTERNNFRAEWLFWFMDNCAEVAEIMARKVKPEKTDRQLFDDFVEELKEDLSHKRIAAAVRRARTR